ncbi:MAG: efflux RND transporter periplasmic adaptor subunit [Dehalococcoidia bacterium]|nr:efflux RND transporter periplasmic adaptor subunit [Dehalococcoidia bacterium]
MKKNLITILIVSMVLLSLLVGGCKKSTATTATPGQVFEVTKGDLNINVSSDGHLTMPDEYDLRFGTNGQVQQIFVEEGDKVKQGALLAMMDDTTQRNAIKTALLAVQTAQNNITVQSKTDSAAAGCDHLPYTYPDLSVPRIMKQAQKDLDTAVSEFKQQDYKDAGRDLVMTYFDIEVAADLVASKPDAAELAGAKTNSTYYPDLYEGSIETYTLTNNATVVDYLQQYQQKLLDISDDMKAGAYDKVASGLEAAEQQMFTAYNLAESTVYLKGSTMFEYPDTATSADFLQASIRSLQDLQDYLAQDNAEPIEAAKKLYITQLNLLVGQDVLENQTSLFAVGKNINWQTLQQYNLALQSAQIALYKAKQAIINTAIIAPADGTVVSVDLKKSSVLSAQTYSSTTAIKLVDTNSIRFEGLIDEIDIMKVQRGQKVTITVDALPNKVFTGSIKFISPFGTKTGNVVKYAITIQMDPTDAELRGGLSATADISIYSVKGVLLLPVSVIVNTREGHVVAVINPTTGQPEYRPITLGQQNLQYAEVTSGLKEGDKVTVTATPPTTGTGTSTQGPRGGAMMIR